MIYIVKVVSFKISILVELLIFKNVDFFRFCVENRLAKVSIVIILHPLLENHCDGNLAEWLWRQFQDLSSLYVVGDLWIYWWSNPREFESHSYH